MTGKILITGASGFIGTNLLDYFYSFKYIVMNFDIVSPKNNKFISFWEKVDITNYDELNDKMQLFRPDYIIHLAARTDLNGEKIEDYNANVVGVKNILAVSRTLSNLKKIIITSSMLVCRLGHIPKNQFDYYPNTIYGESKVISEKLVWENKPTCDWAIIRPTSIWGEWFGKPYKDFFDMVIAKRYFHIGKKSCTKTYGYIGNAIYQIEKILFSDTTNENEKVFYIGDYHPTNIAEWANEIADQLRYKIITFPYFLIYMAAAFGDLLKRIGKSFPMTTFRLRNMTTNNIIDLSATKRLAPNLPYTKKQGIEKTLNWIINN